MAMNTAKRKALVESLRGSEPDIQIENYSSTLGAALSWYSENADAKKLLKYALEYCAKRGLKAQAIALNSASEYDVRQLGVIARLITREQYISEKHMTWFNESIEKLVAQHAVKKTAPKEDQTKPQVVSIQERMDDVARTHAAEFDAAIDDFLTTSSSFSAKNYLMSNSVSAPIAKRIGDKYTKLINEITEVLEGEDKQLVEGYSYLNKRQLKKFLAFVEQIKADCQQQVQTAKASRAPRKRKEASPTKIVSKMRFMREFAELGLKSVRPENIIGSTELWVYNTKTRKLQVYKADGTLSVKGTAVIGFDVKESKSMTLRKPEEFFKGLSLGKRALNNAMKTLTTKPSTPNGRTSEDCVLLGAF
jgi:hypothetical protein